MYSGRRVRTAGFGSVDAPRESGVHVRYCTNTGDGHGSRFTRSSASDCEIAGHESRIRLWDFSMCAEMKSEERNLGLLILEKQARELWFTGPLSELSFLSTLDCHEGLIFDRPLLKQREGNPLMVLGGGEHVDVLARRVLLVWYVMRVHSKQIEIDFVRGDSVNRSGENMGFCCLNTSLCIVTKDSVG